jgi:hypothetical protein
MTPGIPVQEQVLTYAGKVLQGRYCLADCNIQKEATLHLLLRLSGGGHHGPLLPAACGPPIIGDSLTQELVGHRVLTYWPDEDEWWQAVVESVSRPATACSGSQQWAVSWLCPATASGLLVNDCGTALQLCCVSCRAVLCCCYTG